MAEIKHSFTAGKMNKDLDERLVPQGEYRDAMNIQVRTTASSGDGEGDAGVVQNIQGNVQVGTATGNELNEPSAYTPSFVDTNFTCVGSVADEKTDNAYFLFANVTLLTDAELLVATTIQTKIDTIVEQNAITGVSTPVVVDIYEVRAPIASVWSSAPSSATTIDFTAVAGLTDRIRENMTIGFYNSSNLAQNARVKIKKIDGNVIRFYDQVDASSWSNFTHAVFEHPRVLNFNPNNHITGINVIDDLLFWTDGITEPKKINITRGKEGTPLSGNVHTKLYITDNDNDLIDANELEFSGVNSDLLEEHITVLRPAPKTPPTLDVETRDLAELKFNLTDYNSWIAFGADNVEVGSTKVIGAYGTSSYNGVSTPEFNQVPMQPGDTLQVTQEDLGYGEDALKFKVEFVSYMLEANPTEEVGFPTNRIKIKILSTPNFPPDDSMTSWSFEVVNLAKPKFELKFARFGYRYKYEDGEYSAFSPFSELAFDPGLFDYDVKKGYNLGMVNTIQSLKIKDFIPYYTEKALDIKEIEILFKLTSNPTVYTIKSIKKDRDSEWELFTPNDTTVNANNTTQNSIETGSLEIKSETIHRALPSNQILRTFDNVPRIAKAQEITGSRIVYGNYVQGFNLTYPVGLKQNITSQQVDSQPKKSIKTIRDYKVGMVFGDKYGRETPVIVSNRLIDMDSDPDVTDYALLTDDFVAEKEFCAMANKISVQQDWDKIGLPSGTPEDMEWMDYVKYYVKETSNEYYNLVLDRWYYARNQENIWLSFPSADRNKVDEETYLELKKAHGENLAVLEKARYKIIAIENEAPDYIKIDHRFMGEIELNDASVISGGGQLNNAEPNLLTNPEIKKVRVGVTEWNGFLNSYGENMRGQLLARIVGKTVNTSTGVSAQEIVSGEFKKVTHFTKLATGDSESYTGVDFADVHFNKSFGESANMLQRFQDAGYTLNTAEATDSANDLRYFIEFKEEVVENKPEFDGRFFVLIEKDLQIEKNVEELTASSITFVEIDQIAISYVDSQIFNPAQQGPYAIDATTPGNNAYNSNGGVYTGDIFNTGTPVNDITGTSGNAANWWGWGMFSELPTINGSNVYENIQANLFALGCNHDNFANGLNVNPLGTFDGESKTLNYGAVTRTYWRRFNLWHSATGTGNYAQTGNYGVAVPNRVFLDGARATIFDWEEYHPNPSFTGEIGVVTDQGVFNSNDDLLYNPPPSIYNYKPTALDEGIDPSTEGLCRMVLSQTLIDFDNAPSPNFQAENNSLPLNGVGGAQMIHSYFTSDSTYFKFLDDDSNDGEPHVYKVVTKSVDESLAIPVQKARMVKNFAKYDWGGDYNQEIITVDDEFRSKQIATNTYVDQTGVAFNSSANNLNPGNTNITWGGENGKCVDTNGDEVDCWDYVELYGGSDYVDSGIQVDGEPTRLKVGCHKNEGGSGASTIDRYKDQRICKSCSAGLSNCNRASIRFEFRRVDLQTGELLNQGVNPDEFDPRGWAKHDGTAGRVRISILQKSNVIGGEIVEIEEDRSVWETEPKENTELDVYYEASHAIPMQLKKGDTLSYAPLKSKVSTESINLDGDLIPNPLTFDLDGVTYSNVMVGGAEYIENESIIKVISTNSDGNEGLHAKSIGIGDKILFEHSSGLITQSEVQDYYVAPTGSNVTYTPQTSFDVIITWDGAITEALPQGTVSITNTNGTSFDESQAGFGHGMSVTGDGIPGGLFLKFFSGINMQLTDVTWFPDFNQDTNGIEILGYSFTATITLPTGYYKINKDVYKYEVKLGWHNCYSFGNGVESDRIRDDFNAPQIDNGVRVSTTISDYGEENKTSSLIYSGLYNTTSGVNDLNEFNMGEKINKDINPAYGSIQRLKTRDTDVVTFCEDKVLKILANKEAVFNADGNPQLTATDRVLGQVTSFLGDYGISKNPESLASDQYRMYFTDTQRGAVLRLSRDGLTPISNVGMKSWFRENLRGATELLGTFDIVNGEYNLTLNGGETISFNEASKGWVSFKSFVPDEGVSVSGKYFTVKNSGIYEHYVDVLDENGNVNNRNLFYGAEELAWNSQSTITVMFNDIPGTVKSFHAVNYEGSQARINQFTTETIGGASYTDSELYNLTPKHGWWIDRMQTDLQDTEDLYFVDKENKWFSKVTGTQTNLENLDSSEFTVQGIGSPTTVEFPDQGTEIVEETNPDPTPQLYTFKIKNNIDND